MLIEGWFILSWLVNVGWLVILASYHHILQMFSMAARLVRAYELLYIMGLNAGFCCFKGMTYNLNPGFYVGFYPIHSLLDIPSLLAFHQLLQ